MNFQSRWRFNRISYCLNFWLENKDIKNCSFFENYKEIVPKLKNCAFHTLASMLQSRDMKYKQINGILLDSLDKVYYFLNSEVKLKRFQS